MRPVVPLFLVLTIACTDASVAPPTISSSDPSPASPTGSPAPRPAVFSVARVLDTVEELVEKGSREATSQAFRDATQVVRKRFGSLGYTTRIERFSVPAGVSWGIPVPRGRTSNVVAEPGGLDPTEPYLIVGAHLDTVPQAPGANDNAAGVAIVLELARLAAAAPPRMPLVFIAFGAEEPRGPTDDDHHYGSAHHADRLPRARRRALAGVVSIDRVGAGRRALICTGGRSPLALRTVLLRAAERLDHAARACDNRTSDHWPFERRGYTVARMDGGRFDGYHSSRDTVDRLDRTQLRRVGRIAWEALRNVEPDDLS